MKQRDIVQRLGSCLESLVMPLCVRRGNPPPVAPVARCCGTARRSKVGIDRGQVESVGSCRWRSSGPRWPTLTWRIPSCLSPTQIYLTGKATRRDESDALE